MVERGSHRLVPEELHYRELVNRVEGKLQWELSSAAYLIAQQAKLPRQKIEVVMRVQLVPILKFSDA